jgi:hypothetical protein
MYRRVRRNIGRQPVSARRLHIRIGIFILIGALVLFFSLNDVKSLGALLGGLFGGAVLAYFGLQHTKFEATPQGRFYTPRTYIGLLVSALFVGRVAFRFMSLPNPNSFSAYQKSPLTLAMLGALIGYYVVFNIGVLRRSQSPASATPLNS